MSIRVLIADDQALVRAGFRMILETDQDLPVVLRPTTGRRPSRRHAGPGLTSC